MDLISRQAAIDALIELYEYQRDIDPTEAADWQQYKTEKCREYEYIEYRNEVFRRHNTGADRKDRRR